MNSWWKKVAALFGLVAIYLSPVGAQTWENLLQSIRKRFPTVRHVTTQELAAWLADTNRTPHPLLIDARDTKEFEVSHLAGARHLASVDAIRRVVSSPASPVVVYCSVGYRSSALAAKLQKAGLTNVFNLEGSLFAWANEGRPVYRGERPLTPAQVHPYDRKWGQLLRKELHAPARP